MNTSTQITEWRPGDVYEINTNRQGYRLQIIDGTGKWKWLRYKGLHTHDDVHNYPPSKSPVDLCSLGYSLVPRAIDDPHMETDF